MTWYLLLALPLSVWQGRPVQLMEAVVAAVAMCACACA